MAVAAAQAHRTGLTNAPLGSEMAVRKANRVGQHPRSVAGHPLPPTEVAAEKEFAPKTDEHSTTTEKCPWVLLLTDDLDTKAQTALAEDPPQNWLTCRAVLFPTVPTSQFRHGHLECQDEEVGGDQSQTCSATGQLHVVVGPRDC